MGASIHFELNAVRTFAGGIVYLAPSPAEPFRELMRGCGADPSRSEPHVTLAFGAEAAELAALKRYVAPLLPIRSDVIEAHLVLLQARRRELVARLPFSD